MSQKNSTCFMMGASAEGLVVYPNLAHSPYRVRPLPALRRMGTRNRAASCQFVARFDLGERFLVDVREERGMKTVHHVAQPDSEADVHDLLRTEVPGEC